MPERRLREAKVTTKDGCDQRASHSSVRSIIIYQTAFNYFKFLSRSRPSIETVLVLDGHRDLTTNDTGDRVAHRGLLRFAGDCGDLKLPRHSKNTLSTEKNSSVFRGFAFIAGWTGQSSPSTAVPQRHRHNLARFTT